MPSGKINLYLRKRILALSKELTSVQLAERLGLSTKTAQYYRRVLNIKTKSMRRDLTKRKENLQ